MRDVFATFQPLPWAGETDDIAAAAVFLASDAACFINGHDMVIDGGISARGIVTLTSDGRPEALCHAPARITSCVGRTSPDARHQMPRL